MTIGERLLQLRKQQGLSQDELGKKLTVSRQTISLWETDQTLPTIDNLMKLKEIYSVSIDTLLCTQECESEQSAHSADIVQPVEKYRFTYDEQELKSLYSQLNKPAFIKNIVIILLFFALALLEAYCYEMLFSGIFIGLGFMLCIGFLKMHNRNKAANRVSFNRIVRSEYYFDFYDTYFTVSIHKDNELSLFHRANYDVIERKWNAKEFYAISVANHLYVIRKSQLPEDSVVTKLMGKGKRSDGKANTN